MSKLKSRIVDHNRKFNNLNGVLFFKDEAARLRMISNREARAAKRAAQAAKRKEDVERKRREKEEQAKRERDEQERAEQLKREMEAERRKTLEAKRFVLQFVILKWPLEVFGHSL